MATRASSIILHENLPPDCGARDGCATAAVYSSIEAEYTCVRERVGLQDLTHYGKIAVSGEAALELINYLILTDLARLPIHQLQASIMLDAEARPVCDLMILNLGTHYLLLSEGTAPAAVAERLAEVAPQFPGVTIQDRSDELGLLSVDGPYAWELLKVFLGLGVIGTRYREIVPHQVIGGVDTTLARAGKTGEYGYILLCAGDQTLALWDALKQAGEKFALLPIGFRTADLCRMENRVFSQHQEGMAVDNVFELNTRAMFGREKEEFLGRSALESVMQTGVARRIIGVNFDESLDSEKTVRNGAEIVLGGRCVGRLVNAGYSYALKRWIGLALIEDEFACVGVRYSVQTERSLTAIESVSAPFLFNKSMTIRPQEDSFFA